MSHQRVSGFRESVADLRGVPGASGEVWGTSGEVWETSWETLDCLKIHSERSCGEVTRKLLGKSGELPGKSGDFPEAQGSLTPSLATRQNCLQCQNSVADVVSFVLKGRLYLPTTWKVLQEASSVFQLIFFRWWKCMFSSSLQVYQGCNSETKKQPKDKFWGRISRRGPCGYPGECPGANSSVRPSKSCKKTSIWARTAMTRRPKTSVRKLRAEFLFTSRRSGGLRI